MSDQPKESSKSAPTYEDRILHVSVISKPLASKKHTKRVYKLIRKATKGRAIKHGVKEVVKAIRKGEKGLCVIAGDISPVDVVAHIPVLCEENDIPYIFTPSKVDLGASAQSKRPTSCILITPSKPNFTEKELYEKLFEEVKDVQIVY
ncbi:unnamed protein product [Albugo candida]|uniref:H/ACA ribonucleoprotein complex subunit 2 n=1 Tax=Albugo candida TaxID=65357 RepID=A0A024G290_9STRA|nr:unnamed protein product [Albugo candida]|eukprot:CCI40958.1 unnamed protein product [Albugo candida]